MPECQRRERDPQRAVAIRDSQGIRRAVAAIAELDRGQHDRRRWGFKRPAAFVMAQPAYRPDPHASIVVCIERVRVAVVPDEPLRTIHMMPLAAGKDVYAIIRPRPQSSARIKAQKQDQIRSKPIAARIVLDDSRIAVKFDSREPDRFAVANPHCAVGTDRNVGNGGGAKAVMDGPAPPYAIAPVQQAFARRDPYSALRIGGNAEKAF